jgi:glycosyltransferase involved in cell wall biosynthesis
MLFSILIANFNNSEYLKTALRSAIWQNYEQWEVILVDDGSTDDFDIVANSFAYESRIKVFRNHRNFGCGYTKKKCISFASGSIAGFLDPDDMLAPEAVACMVNAHLQQPGYSIIHSTHYICNDQLNPVRIAEYPKALPHDMPYLLLSDGRIHHFASFKKSFYDKTAGLSAHNKKAVDQDLYYLLEETGPVEFINVPLYYYRIHQKSISTSGKERETTLWHYEVIQEACKRRIKQLKIQKEEGNMMMGKYRLRYNKIGILKSFRRKNPFMFLYHSIIFIFTGGMGNLLSYMKKLPEQGFPMIRRTFFYDHQIKA